MGSRWILIAVLLVACGITTALLVEEITRAIGDSEAIAAVMGNAATPPDTAAAPPTATISPPALKAILERPLFTPSRRRPEPASVPAQVAPPPRLESRLLGFVQRNGVTLAILSRSGGGAAFVRVGSEIEPGWTVQAIRAGQIVVRGPSEEVVLSAPAPLDLGSSRTVTNPGVGANPPDAGEAAARAPGRSRSGGAPSGLPVRFLAPGQGAQ